MRRIITTDSLLNLHKALTDCQRDIENFTPTNIIETMFKARANDRVTQAIKEVVEKVCKQLDEDGF